MELRIPKVVELEPWALMMSSRDNANLSHLGEEQKISNIASFGGGGV